MPCTFSASLIGSPPNNILMTAVIVVMIHIRIQTLVILLMSITCIAVQLLAFNLQIDSNRINLIVIANSAGLHALNLQSR